MKAGGRARDPGSGSGWARLWSKFGIGADDCELSPAVPGTGNEVGLELSINSLGREPTPTGSPPGTPGS
ncbi:hypothetical protein GCM10022235_20130 [Kribbella ginsengisoli]|uniref:Uncharacterized protein n=1 Tax=Kribbella ginsengisoli TaxID=363865 RepID=A0ABP6WIU7_9ACTN